MTEQHTDGQTDALATFEEVKVSDLHLNDVVQGQGLVVKIEDDGTGKVVGFGSTRTGKPHVEKSVPFGADDTVRRALVSTSTVGSA